MTTKSSSTGSGLVGSQVFFTGLLGIITLGFLGYSDIETKMAFYGAYHQQPLNMLIHLFGVPGLVWSALLFGVHLPIPMLENVKIGFVPGIPVHTLNYGFLGAAIYGLSYLFFDPVGGLLFAPLLFLMYASAVIIRQRDQQSSRKKFDGDQISSPWFGSGSVLKLALFAHVFCWYMQIHPGHAIIEGAKPALMDSLRDSFTVGPLFAYHELIFYLGLRPELHDRVQVLIAEHTKELCAAGSTMKACAAL